MKCIEVHVENTGVKRKHVFAGALRKCVTVSLRSLQIDNCCKHGKEADSKLNQPPGIPNSGIHRLTTTPLIYICTKIH